MKEVRFKEYFHNLNEAVLNNNLSHGKDIDNFKKTYIIFRREDWDKCEEIKKSHSFGLNSNLRVETYKLVMVENEEIKPCEHNQLKDIGNYFIAIIKKET